MLRAALLIFLLGILFLGTFLFVRLGYYKSVQIEKKVIPATKIIFSEHMGAYHKIVPVIEKVETWAKNNGLSCKHSFGEYFDDPKVVDEVRLRSRGGCLIEPQEQLPLSLGPDMKVEEWPARTVIEGVFEGSPSLGPLKVYPRIKDYLSEARLQTQGSIVEIYELLPEGAVKTRYQFSVD